jgi:glyoxylase-like metal-dependent hydrolase (beta-lactamase superfamily II)
MTLERPGCNAEKSNGVARTALFRHSLSVTNKEFPIRFPAFVVLAGWLLCLGFALPIHLAAAPGAGHPLTLTRGQIRPVATVPALKAALDAANRAKVPATLLLADGTYLLDVPALDILCPGLVIRSATGNRDAVIVRGPDEGPQAAVANVFLVSANDVVIADLTLGYCRFHGIQVRGESPFDVSGLQVHNCRIVNCNQQFIKGSSSDADPVGATDGCIEQCLFEFTSGWAYQSYTGGIDIHKGVNWIVRDNLFRNLRTTAGQNGIAEHAVHFWKRCPTRPQNVVVECNWVVNCDRGIGFGLGNAAGGLQGGSSVIRNNLVFNDGTGPRTDVGIGLEHAANVQVDNNTVVIQKYWAPIEYRFAGCSNLVFRNNLVNRPIQRRDDAPPAPQTNNLQRVEMAWFRDFATGDLRLTTAAKPALNAGQTLAGFHDDVDGQPRPQGATWDIGAHQLSAASLPPGLLFIPGPVNGAFLQRHGKTLAVYGDPSGSQPPPDTLLLTEARRDATWAARGLAQRGAKVVAPEKEADLLTQPGKFWAELREERFHDYAQQSTKVPIEAIPVSRTVKGGDTLAWGDLALRVLDTPGYTRGAVSYLVELGGRKVAFTGDLIRDDGKLQDLFSLQDAIPEAKVGGYHGWAGRLGELMASLDRIAAAKPDLLVPLRGPVIRDPPAALGRLQNRIRAVYANYLSIDALRWYFKDDHIRAKARRVLEPDAQVSWMAMAETLPLPEAIIPISNSRLILAADRSGFLVDCGGTGIIDQLRKLRAAGKLTSLEHVFVTHYHDDHTDALPALVAEFGAKVHACGSLVDLLERPGDYRLPCLTRNPAKVTAPHRDHDTWRWKEYQLTIFDYPGQTFHHNALLVARDGGWSAFFAGDSFTPSGIDDYCLQNRNFLREGQGFFRCLDQLEKLPDGCLILNQHVEPAFRFTPAQLAQMRQTLRRRIPLLADLLPFDDPNYGLDESWAALHPYWITLRPGQSATLALRITNHSPREQTFRAVAHAPAGFRVTGAEPVRIPPHADDLLPMIVHAPADAPPGLHVLVADVAWGDTHLREWTEAVLEVVP